MENKNDLWYRTTVRAALIAFALGCFSLSAHADTTAAPDAFEKFLQRSTGAGKQTVGFGSNGMPLSSPGVPSITPDGGLPRVDSSGGIRNPSGNTVPVGVKARIPGAQAAKAIGRALGKGLVPGVGLAIMIKEIAEALGWGLDVNPDGTTTIKKPDPLTCTVAPCNQWQGQQNGVWYSSHQAAAEASVGSKAVCTSNPTGYYQKSLSSIAPPNLIYFRYAYCPNDFTNTSDNIGYLQTRTVAPSPPTWLPSDEQEFLDKIASQSGWPSSSAIGRTLAEATRVAPEIKIIPEGVTVTGPATSPGTTTTTTNTTNNTTKNETTTHQHTYQGDTVTTTTVTVTNITNNTTGDTISSETKTETPVKEEREETDLCKDYPDRLGCMDQDVPEGEIPRETKTITYSEENVFGSGSCPTNLTASIGTLGATVTVWDWQKTCAAALPLRALVIALASFAALLIVMPGRVET